MDGAVTPHVTCRCDVCNCQGSDYDANALLTGHDAAADHDKPCRLDWSPNARNMGAAQPSAQSRIKKTYIRISASID
jgi:hypothetical protein